MAIHIGICDDTVEDIKRLKEALYAYDPSFHITDYVNGDFLLEDCEEQKILYDIIFLDIYMPHINGIEIATQLRNMYSDVKIVFISSSNEHYSDAYDVFAFNYLIKPFDMNKLYKVLDQALMNINKERYEQILFSYKSKNYRILCKDIIYVESSDKIIYFYTTDGSIYQCYAKLDEIMNQLPKEHFIRCHQSYAVNIIHVTEMNEAYFGLGEVQINISRRYRKEAKELYFKHLFKQMNP